MRSILDTGFSTRAPQQNATIPFGYYANGAPFLIYSQAEITSFKIVCLRTRLEKELSPTIILSEGSKRYYKSTHELGVPRGSYFYKIGIGEYYKTVDSLVSTAFNSIAKVDYSNQYGGFEIDVDYVDGKFLYFELIAAGYSDFISMYIDGNSVEVTCKNSGTVMDAVNYTMTETGNYKISVKRNSEADEFFVGGVGETQIAINGTIIFDDVTGDESFNYSLSDDLDFIQWQAGEGIGVRSINDFLPADFTITSNTFEIQQKPTDELAGGSPIYSQVFKIDEHMRGPTPEVGDFNSDFNNDFLNFEASGVIDENGDEC